MKLPANFETLVDEVRETNLYEALVLQLNKDLRLANIHNHSLSAEMRPELLKIKLENILSALIADDFRAYLNLLYTVDVSEQMVKGLKELDPSKIATKVCFLILQREWQKVWFRHKMT